MQIDSAESGYGFAGAEAPESTIIRLNPDAQYEVPSADSGVLRLASRADWGQR